MTSNEQRDLDELVTAVVALLAELLSMEIHGNFATTAPFNQRFKAVQAALAKARGEAVQS